MVCIRCVMLVKSELEQLQIPYSSVIIGEVDLMSDITILQKQILQTKLQTLGLEIIDNKKAVLVEKIIHCIYSFSQMIQDKNEQNFTEYVSQNIDYDYTYLSNIFQELQGITIEHFFIVHRISLAKELLHNNELNITEIAYKLHFSSVSHLSNQFKKETGFTPSQYKLQF